MQADGQGVSKVLTLAWVALLLAARPGTEAQIGSNSLASTLAVMACKLLSVQRKPDKGVMLSSCQILARHSVLQASLTAASRVLHSSAALQFISMVWEACTHTSPP